MSSSVGTCPYRVLESRERYEHKLLEHLRERYHDVPLIKVFKEWKSEYGEMGVYGLPPYGPLVIAVLNEDGSQSYTFDDPRDIDGLVKHLEVVAKFAGAQAIQS